MMENTPTRAEDVAGGFVTADTAQRLYGVVLTDGVVDKAATAKPVPMIAACRVVGRVQPAITFEVWMPVSGWNGKFQAVGGRMPSRATGMARRSVDCGACR